jgi:hypothetical protein
VSSNLTRLTRLQQKKAATRVTTTSRQYHAVGFGDNVVQELYTSLITTLNTPLGIIVLLALILRWATLSRRNLVILASGVGVYKLISLAVGA